MGAAVSFGGSGASNALLAPLVQLSFWKMKDRACRFGESGGFAFLSALMDSSRSREVRFHLMGHSFGCIAASACACGSGNLRLPGRVYSVVLVQGALSLWSYCASIPQVPGKAGYFRKLISRNATIGPIVTTQSTHDTAVGSLYPMAAGAAGQVAMAPGDLPKYGGVGTFGARGDGLDIIDLVVQNTDFEYGFEPNRIYNIDCSTVICDGGPPSGAHSDIAKPEIAHLVWSASW
jgi:pimeloyl-ACP methyl ester carboxylesterase